MRRFQQRRYTFETLEHRTLLSYTLSMEDGTLEIVGTDARECIYAIYNDRTHETEIKEFCRGDRKTVQIVLGEVVNLRIDLGAGDDKLILKGFTADDIDIFLGAGEDTARYYDGRNKAFCIDLGPGNDAAKARRNVGDTYMINGGSGRDILTNWGDTNDWAKREIDVEIEQVFRNNKARAA